jgi:tetratricopeptide (TPR) repeat protein
MYKLIRFSGTSSENGTEHCVKRNLVPLLGLYSRCKQVCTGSPCDAELRLRSRLAVMLKCLDKGAFSVWILKFNNMNNRLLILVVLTISFVSCVRSQNKENGIKYYEQGLKSPTSNEDARKLYNLGYIEFSRNNYYTAIDYYKKAIKLDPQYTDAIDNLALSYRRINNLDSAERYYKLSLNVLSTNELAWNNLAVVYIYKDELEKAKLTYRKLISVNNQYGDAFYGMSEIFLRQNNGDSAVYYGLIAYQIWKDNNIEFSRDALRYIVSGYLMMNDKNKAKEYFAIAKEIGTKFSSEIEAQMNK